MGAKLHVKIVQKCTRKAQKNFPKEMKEEISETEEFAICLIEYALWTEEKSESQSISPMNYSFMKSFSKVDQGFFFFFNDDVGR